jgi:hypothetical protein
MRATRYAGLFIVACLWLSSLSIAQSQFSAFTGIHLPQVWGTGAGDNPSGVLRLHWLPAMNLGTSIQFGVADWFDVSPSIEYNLYIFDSYHQQTIAAPPILVRSSGRSSHALRIAVDARFVDRSSSSVSFYALTGLGYVANWIGAIDLTWSSPGSESHLSHDPESNWVQTFGGGFQYQLSSVYSLDGSIRCFADYRNPIDLSMNIGFSYLMGK